MDQVPSTPWIWRPTWCEPVSAPSPSGIWMSGMIRDGHQLERGAIALAGHEVGFYLQM